jgi:hypothetical protein
MKLGRIARTCGVALLFVLSGACSAPHQEAKTGKGHWETLPVVTGSMVQRKVWVDENGNVSSPPDAGTVRQGSTGDLERAARNSGSVRPPTSR